MTILQGSLAQASSKREACQIVRPKTELIQNKENYGDIAQR